MEFIDNQEISQYEIHFEGELVRMEYKKSEGKIYIVHTQVPEALKGMGYGSKIVKRALEAIAKEKLALVPLCPFVVAYIKKHPEWKHLVFKRA